MLYQHKISNCSRTNVSLKKCRDMNETFLISPRFARKKCKKHWSILAHFKQAQSHFGNIVNFYIAKKQKLFLHKGFS